MTPAEYRALRRERGTLKQVARKLGIDWTTLQRRETGKQKITHEAVLAMIAITPVDYGFQNRLIEVLIEAKIHTIKSNYRLYTDLNNFAMTLSQYRFQEFGRTITPKVFPDPPKHQPRNPHTRRKLHLK